MKSHTITWYLGAATGYAYSKSLYALGMACGCVIGFSKLGAMILAQPLALLCVPYLFLMRYSGNPAEIIITSAAEEKAAKQGRN